MSRGGAKNPDRRREIKEFPIPFEIARLLEPGTKGYRMGRCSIYVSQQAVGYHLSISRPDRLPSWEEARDARYELIPEEALMVLLLPAKEVYVNVHEFCLQLYEIPSEYIDVKDTL